MTYGTALEATRQRIGAFVLTAALVAGSSGCDWAAQPETSDADVGETTDVAADADTEARREAGEQCDAPGQCVDGTTCIGNPLDTYTCMRTCEDVWTLCDDGSVCTPVANGAPICYTGGVAHRGEPCDSNLECRSGLLCVGVRESEYYCLEACHTSEGGCNEREYCNAFGGGGTGKGYCRRKIGAPCSTDAQCLDDLECTSGLPAAVRSQFPGGYCTRTGCTEDADCPGSAHCRTYPDSDVSMCFAACDFDAGCRLTGDYACLTRERCRRAAGSENCNAFRDEADICVPPPLTTWTGT